MAGCLLVVATPIGNLEDITLRALRVLREADLIAAEDTRRTARLLQHYSISTPTTSLHEHNERQKLPTLLDRLAAGQRLALVSDAGTPTISDPGARLVAAALDRGFRVESVPGPSAVVAALSVSGFEGSTFTFLGFPPIRSKDRIAWVSRLALDTGIVVFFEAPHRIARTLQELETKLGERPITIARELTKIHEDLVKGPIKDVIRSDRRPRGEYAVVVGPSTALLKMAPAVPDDEHFWSEFGHMVEKLRFSRRQAIAHIARAHRVPAREVYAAVERAKRTRS